jgi:S1-C subfamily serine protease
VDGRAIRRSSELQEIIGRKRPGDRVAVEVLRKGKKRSFEVILRNQEGTTDAVEKDIISSSAGLGATFEVITKEDKELLGIGWGLKIKELRTGKLSRLNIPEGFVITHVNRRPVKSVEELNTILSVLKPGEGVMIEGMFPNGRPGYFAFGW